MYFYCAKNTIIIISAVTLSSHRWKKKATLRQCHISDTLEWCNGTIDNAPEYIFEHGEPVPNGNESELPVAAEEPVEYGR